MDSSPSLAQLVAELYSSFSAARLNSYRPPHGTDEQMLCRYVWNIALCEALYPALHMLEIALRNTVHQAVADQFSNPAWFDTPGLLQKWQLRDLATARTKVANRNSPKTVDRIVAELNFGFWTSILSQTYHHRIWNLSNAAPLRSAFPFLTGPTSQRRQVHARFNDLRGLRNRVFHFEPVWNDNRLNVKHDQIVEAISWINPTTAEILALFDRFPTVYDRGFADLRETILGVRLVPHSLTNAGGLVSVQRERSYRLFIILSLRFVETC